MRRLAALLFLPFLLALAPTQAELDDADRRVAAIGYRLQTAGVKLCSDRDMVTGLLIHGLAQYAPADRPQMVERFPAAAAFAVLAVVPGSTAEAAGLAAGDPLFSVDGAPFVAGDAGPASFAPVAAAEQQIAAALADGTATLESMAGDERRTVSLRGVPGCRTRFQVRIGDRLNAGANGHYVTVTTGLVAFAANDDELALILAHELSHNILRHRERLDAQGVARGMLSAFGSNPGRIRATEDEADRLALYLMARAGYDIGAAPAFWDRYVRRTGAGIFSDRTHSGRRARVAAAEEEIARIRAQVAAGREPTPEPAIVAH
ncbi:hypothetical protein GGR88_001569 [Sphingomonas jejuensis]|uniref:Peptidase M48 domain-containing protein n=1 Tax=Sphingomonas jejuensis TaxID=904715 RepID=A0ABX0XLJ1_9SPHN|nr:M48 family metallopeptidase [Sphingomonas jejuensis]NJC34095.1 hypothetical protein [Sphingomonas jejuensis]